MRFVPAVLSAILFGLYCAFMVPALITKNTPKYFEMAVTVLVMLFTLTLAMLLVAINNDSSKQQPNQTELQK